MGNMVVGTTECIQNVTFFFSRTRRRAAHQYIKKIKMRERASRKKKNVTGIEDL